MTFDPRFRESAPGSVRFTLIATVGLNCVKRAAREAIPDGGRNGKVGTEIDSANRSPVSFANLPVLPVAVYSLAELETIESRASNLLMFETKRCTKCI